MSQLQPLTLGAESRRCFLINEDALVQDAGTGPLLTNITSGQQVWLSLRAYDPITVPPMEVHHSESDKQHPLAGL